jgi:hypothetical protein
MKLKCPNLLKPLDTIIQENHQPFYPSEPFRITRFQMRHPVSKYLSITYLLTYKYFVLFINTQRLCYVSELAKDHLTGKGIRVLGGIVSPVNDAYEKKSLTVNSSHRVKMVNLALQNYDFVKCSKWEAEQSKWTRTRAVLDHYDSQVR